MIVLEPAQEKASGMNSNIITNYFIVMLILINFNSNFIFFESIKNHIY